MITDCRLLEIAKTDDREEVIEWIRKEKKKRGKKS